MWIYLDVLKSIDWRVVCEKWIMIWRQTNGKNCLSTSRKTQPDQKTQHFTTKISINNRSDTHLAPLSVTNKILLKPVEYLASIYFTVMLNIIVIKMKFHLGFIDISKRNPIAKFELIAPEPSASQIKFLFLGGWNVLSQFFFVI